MGLDGKPRPIHLSHGEQVLDWSRTTQWTAANLVNRIDRVGSGPGWVEERTGLHDSQFIETRRHRFHEPVLHTTDGTVQVVALVEGEWIDVESPEGGFPPYRVHYGEVIIVPAAVGAFLIRPSSNHAHQPHITLKAYVRSFDRTPSIHPQPIPQHD
jgi:mannose-6-phosphate isomerase